LFICEYTEVGILRALLVHTGQKSKIRNCGNFWKKNWNCRNFWRKKSELWEVIQNYVNISKNSTIRNCGNFWKKSELWKHLYILRFGIVGTYFKNRNCGNIFKNRNCGTYFSELWDSPVVNGKKIFIIVFSEFI
jgi:hypothetical protein